MMLLKNSKLVIQSLLIFAGSLLYVSACQNNINDIEQKEMLSGGSSTSFDFSVNAFSHPSSALSTEQKRDFVVGNSFFKQNWVTAPSTTTDRDGLGPLFNAASCSSCHIRDGRGLTPESLEESTLGLLFRLSDLTGNPHPIYGSQLQNHGILGVDAEAIVRVSYEVFQGTFSDGERYEWRKPKYEFRTFMYGGGNDFTYSPRIAPQIIGMGLLEAMDEEHILSMEDPDDTNHDGISGRANYVINTLTGALELGKLGWKANQPNVRHQTAAAFLGDLGITSSVFQEEELSFAEASLKVFPKGGNPEIEDQLLDKVVLYTSSLSVPAKRTLDTKTYLRGKELFSKALCDRCHIPKHVTGKASELEIFHNQTIYPYTDLLLHDMGEGLADGRADGLASGNEWRTPPLWGIGLIKTVNGVAYLLHDGRARNIQEAIVWHGGEGEASKDYYLTLTSEERKILCDFVESL